MVFFYKVYIGYIGGNLYSANSSIGYCIGHCIWYCTRYFKGICSRYSERHPIRISKGYIMGYLYLPNTHNR